VTRATLHRLFPERLDNRHVGHPVALWIFGLVVTARTLQALVVTFDSRSVARTADGIPLDTFPPAAAATVVALFALSGLYRLVLSAVCLVAWLRYRSAIPFLFLVLVIEGLAKQLLLRLLPLATTGAPPGAVVNLTLTSLLVVGFALSLWRPRADRQPASRPEAPARPAP
jgi:hypothetical protein